MGSHSKLYRSENPRVAGSIPAQSSDDDPNPHRELGFCASGVLADRVDTADPEALLVGRLRSSCAKPLRS